MKELNQFIIAKARAQGIRLGDVAKRCNFSRSTLYRYMKGILPIVPEVESVFAQVLELNDEEVEELRRLIALTVFNEAMLKARVELDRFVFGEHVKENLSDMDIVFYNNDRFLRTLHEVFERILVLVKQDFSCKVHLLNGVRQPYFDAVAAFLTKLFALSGTSSVEHLISFSETDFHESIGSLIAVLPLLQHDRYDLFYSETCHSNEIRDYLKHSIYVEMTREKNSQKEHQFFLFSFFDQGMPECIAFSDVYMHHFIIKNYNEVKRQFQNGFHEYRNINVTEKFLMDRESRFDAYLLKPNPCYNKIPIAVYESLMNRIDPTERKLFAEKLMRTPLSNEQADTAIQLLLSNLKKRVNLSCVHHHIDVYSKAGLLELAQTGRISDHLDYLPSFSKEETRMCLQYIRDRNNAPNDSYRMYLTQNQLLTNQYIIVAFKKDGILIEYSKENYCETMSKNLYIKNKTIAQILCDYAENHIPGIHAVSKAEATAYINWLLEEYC